MGHSMPGFPVYHQFMNLAHVHQVSDAIQPSHESGLNIQKFMVHVLLKLGLGNFEHYFLSV